MVITVHSVVLISLDGGRSYRGIILIYFVELPIEMGFLTNLCRKKRLVAFNGVLTILFVYTFGCYVIQDNWVWCIQGNVFPRGFLIVNVFVSGIFWKAVSPSAPSLSTCSFLKATLKESFSSALSRLFPADLLSVDGARKEDLVWKSFAESYSRLWFPCALNIVSPCNLIFLYRINIVTSPFSRLLLKSSMTGSLFLCLVKSIY